MPDRARMSSLEPVHEIPLIALHKWIGEIGITSVTAWRWRQRGWISTINIAGRHYIAREEIERFHRRAEAGEFAKKAITPDNVPE